MQALDELVARWRKNPDPESTLALCAHLGTTPQKSELLREVGNAADAWHRDNHGVMLSVGRMYLEAGLLAEAQASFVQAGKIAPNDAEAYRLLGEVLLRRGDALRGEKALGRAIKLGDADPETRLWHERSIIYGALQQRKGMSAVAEEVARTAPIASLRGPSSNPLEASPRATAAAARPQRRSRPPAAGAPRPTGPRRSSPPTAARRRTSSPPVAPKTKAAGAKTEPFDTLLMGQTPLPVPRVPAPVHPPSPFYPSESHAPGRRQPARAESPAASSRSQAMGGERVLPASAEPIEDARRPFFPPDPPPTPASDPVPSDPFRGTFPEDGMSSPALSAPLPDDVLRGPAPVSLPPDPQLLQAFGQGEETTETGAWSAPAGAVSDDASPTPETLLLTLAQVGLYETSGGVSPVWEAPPRASPRRLWLASAAAALILGLGVAGYKYAQVVESSRLARVQELEARLAGLLESGTRADLTASEAEFQVLFEIDSRSPEAALLWLDNRVLHALTDGEPVSGIESAMQRARSLGVEEARLVFGRLASALQAGDLPGAGQIISEWDARARDDARYELLAGAIFERAGNAEALARFTRAAELQPNLKLAQLMAARLALLQLGPEAAKGAVERATSRLGPGPAADVLRGLEWATSSTPAAAPPPLPEAATLTDQPPLVQSTHSAVLGVRMLREGKLAEARESFRAALGPAATPALTAWVGYQALEAGDIETARSAAIQAMKLSAVHTNNQALAVRIALAEGRLEQARQAAAGLDQSSREATLIEAVSAYESSRASEVTRFVRGISGDAAAGSNLEALGAGAAVITGQGRWAADALERFSREQQIWGSIIAVDLAMDRGALDFAQKLMEAQRWDAERPSHAVRMLRLRRHQGQLDAALDLVRPLLTASDVTPRAVAESVLALVEGGRPAAATSALEQAGDRAGELTPWLNALVDASSDRRARATKTLAGRALPGSSDPVIVQIVALRALAAVKDKRAPRYLAQLAHRLPHHPDVKLAARELAAR